MKCKRTGSALPAIWKHPAIDGQFVAALTREQARLLFMTITGRDVPADGFSRTGDFAWRSRIISTFDAYRDSRVDPADMNGESTQMDLKQ